MRLHLPAPRLLPLTIGVLAALLSVKTAGLVRLAFAAPALAAPAPAPAAPVPANQAPVPAPSVDRAPQPSPGTSAATPPPRADAAGAPVPATPKPVEISESERALLLDLRRRREDLDSRERQYAGREAVIAAAERRLTQRVAEMQALQAKLDSLEAAREQREEANWRGLVKVYESMKPRDAAVIFNDLDMQVLLPVLDRMKEGKAAPVLAAMQPDKARQATASLAQLRLKQTTPPNGS